MQSYGQVIIDKMDINNMDTLQDTQPGRMGCILVC